MKEGEGVKKPSKSGQRSLGMFPKAEEPLFNQGACETLAFHKISIIASARLSRLQGVPLFVGVLANYLCTQIFDIPPSFFETYPVAWRWGIGVNH